MVTGGGGMVVKVTGSSLRVTRDGRCGGVEAEQIRRCMKGTARMRATGWPP
jgi:hypothetical protein